MTVKPCTVQDFEPQNDTIRICHLSAGKLKIMLGGRQFAMGVGGTFKIDKSISARLENWFYVDAVVFITAIRV